jgi:glycosyltransferase involved in cell wall biosynthesis
MTGTFGLRPKGTMSARAAGIASALSDMGWTARIVTVPWDSPADAGTEETINGIPVRNTQFVSPYSWPISVAEIVREARAFQPDLVHLFKPKGFGDLAARHLRRSGIPVVVDMDDWEGTRGWNDLLPYSRLQRRLFNWQERSWPSQADGLTTASKALEQYALELGAPPSNILYLPNLLTAERFDSLRNPPPTPLRGYDISVPTSHPTILLYTRFVEFSPRFVVEILNQVIASVPDAQLIIAGVSADGNAERELENEARQAGNRDRIHALGWIDPDDLGWIAAQCSAALVPFDDTILNRSKCSAKLLELIATGIPVVASSVGENREYLNRHEAGSLARPGDSYDHASKLGLILSNLHPGNVCNRKRIFPRGFLWEHVTDELEHHYLASIRRIESV